MCEKNITHKPAKDAVIAFVISRESERKRAAESLKQKIKKKIFNS